MNESLENLSVVNEHEAARLLGLSVQTLRNWRHIRRGVPYCKHGRSVVYRLADIETFQMQHRIDPEANQ